MKRTNSLSPLYNPKCFFLKVHFSKTCCKSLKVMTFYDSLIQISGETFISCILKKLPQKQSLGAGFFLNLELLYVESLCLIKASAALICRMFRSNPKPPFYSWGNWEPERGPKVTQEGTARIKTQTKTSIAPWQHLINQALWLWKIFKFYPRNASWHNPCPQA